MAELGTTTLGRTYLGQTLTAIGNSLNTVFQYLVGKLGSK